MSRLIADRGRFLVADVTGGDGARLHRQLLINGDGYIEHVESGARHVSVMVENSGGVCVWQGDRDKLATLLVHH